MPCENNAKTFELSSAMICNDTDSTRYVEENVSGTICIMLK